MYREKKSALIYIYSGGRIKKQRSMPIQSLNCVVADKHLIFLNGSRKREV